MHFPLLRYHHHPLSSFFLRARLAGTNFFALFYTFFFFCKGVFFVTFHQNVAGEVIDSPCKHRSLPLTATAPTQGKELSLFLQQR
jgi:hypothetical protein